MNKIFNLFLAQSEENEKPKESGELNNKSLENDSNKKFLGLTKEEIDEVYKRDPKRPFDN